MEYFNAHGTSLMSSRHRLCRVVSCKQHLGYAVSAPQLTVASCFHEMNRCVYETYRFGNEILPFLLSLIDHMTSKTNVLVS